MKTIKLSRFCFGVTISLIVVLVYFFFQYQRKLFFKKHCYEQLAHLSFALNCYKLGHNAFPFGTIQGSQLTPEERISWMPSVLSYTDYFQGSTILFDKDKPWHDIDNRFPMIKNYSDDGLDSSVRRSTTPPSLPILKCPADPKRLVSGELEPTNYVGIAGLGTDAATLATGHPRAGVFGYDRITRIDDLKDGSSTTMTLAETSVANGPWIAGGPSTVRGIDQRQQPYIGKNRQFGGTHPAGVMAAFADGSVRFLSKDISPNVFGALSTVAGGEPIPVGW